MTQAEIDQYLIEVEQRFRARTPAVDVTDALPAYRVGRGEMRTWFSLTFHRDMTLDDTFQLEIPLKRLYQKLRRAFPHELWDLQG